MNQSLDLKHIKNANAITTEKTIVYVNSLLDVWLLLILSSVGIVTNAMTIAVFRHQGWKEGVNISMTTIALLDLIRCVLTILKRIHGFIELISVADGVSWSNLTTPNAEFVNILTSYVSFALLAYVSLERCLCVAMPFTMKTVFTPKRTLIILIAIAAFVYLSLAVMCFNFSLDFVFSDELNSTIIILVRSDFYNTHRGVVDPYLNSMSMLVPTVSFIVLSVSSLILLRQLKTSRDAVSENKTNEPVLNLPNHKTVKTTFRFSKREKQVTKMLLVVVSFYIGNLVPRVTWFVGQFVEPEFRALGEFQDFYMMAVTLMFILDLVHASANFFIFYTMSSGFKRTFDQLMTCSSQTSLQQ
ncbi:G-protein coupled receptor frpr-1 [Biomphalaria pfeifferi]|uniref:G-protein coupled receptor frpr-1 n=1 Tax=Biomphalaria pfeifferi TaxID=112525 RepID=A0AAD8FHK4_BIOPF|nr:G-protein coupled receptor frpr-1 [Biomphalaria pfeifferi]